MVQFFSKRRLKIVEQIIIVVFFAIIVPMTVSGIIINNVNQQSNRKQLRESATMIANIVSDEIDVVQTSINNELNQIILTMKYYNLPEKNEEYLRTINSKNDFYKELRVMSPYELKKLEENKDENNYAIFSQKIDDNKNLVAILDINKLKNDIFKSVDQNKRQIYVLSASDNHLIASVNFEQEIFENTVKQLPKTLQNDATTVYGNIKNQPIVYHKKTNPNVIIIVNTTENLTRKIIDSNRDKIILSTIITALVVFFVIGLYTSYLYINIRQLFKAIIAISKGNYGRRIRLLTNIFTPFEIVFLSNEFNRMVSQIHKSYIQLKKKNKELKQLNEFRSNMIDTVSHEFRTPLTSIQGYTSRLLRQDIEIDEETKQKSLKIIKKQAERLTRMVEDILVIPDLEKSTFNFDIKPVSLDDTIENAIMLVKNDSQKVIVNNINVANLQVYADSDRLEQVFVNLIENAIKYSKENSNITLDSELRKDKIVVSVKNDYDVIPREKLKTLFDKFTRIDDSTTRTTRGTGLGLFIVKGLVEGMGGEIRLYSNEECGFCVKLYLPLVVQEEIYE